MFTKSIKSLLPELEMAFRVDAGLIYERQRALVRAGLLRPREGRGPGSGVAATPRALSMLLLALMASDNPAAGAERAARLSKLVPATPGRGGICRLTGKKNLLDAIAFMVGEDPEGLFPTLSISRDEISARLTYDGDAARGERPVSEFFRSRDPKRQEMPNIKIEARFSLIDLWAVLNAKEQP
jgi:hypothetical protein